MRDGIKNPVLTAKVGNNNELFPDILDLYVPKGSKVLDMTWGKGIFWRDVNTYDYNLVTNDLDYSRGDIQADSRHLPFDAESFDCCVYDPPYLYTGGWRTLRDFGGSGSPLYKNKERAKHIRGVHAVDQMYYDSMTEAYRLLRHKGMLLVKCMDQVQSGKQQWAHMVYSEYAEEIGFRLEDLFVLVRKSKPLMRHKVQRHARRNHSYFLVCKAWKR